MQFLIPIEKIIDNPFQENRDYSDVEELAERIAAAVSTYPDTRGLMQVPRARIVLKNGRYPGGHSKPFDNFNEKLLARLINDRSIYFQLAYGHRRKRAVEHLIESGYAAYEDGRMMLIISNDMSDQQMLDAVWSENKERKNISAVEEARLLEIKIETEGLTQAQAAEAWGIGRSTVANRLRLLELPEEAKAANRAGELSERQAQALTQVVRIEKGINGRQLKWGDGSSYWDPPMSPESFVKKFLRKPDKFTGDEVRDYAKELAEHAGEPLAKNIASYECERPGTVQPTCKGCIHRFNNTCLKPDCLEVKQSHFIAAKLEEVSAETGYPISDSEMDFDFDYEERQQLRDMWAAGASANYVIGWRPGESGAFPWGKNEGWCFDGERFDGNGRNAVALGHRGPFPAAALEAVGQEAAEQEDIPDAETRGAWGEQARAAVTKAKKAIRVILRTELINEIASTDAIQALICSPDKEWLDEHNKVISRLLDVLWDNGTWKGLHRHSRGLSSLLASLDSLAERTGIDSATYIDLEGRILVALDHWYDHRGYTWTDTFAIEGKEMLEAVQRLIEEAGGHPLDHEVGRALKDIEQRLESEKEST